MVNKMRKRGGIDKPEMKKPPWLRVAHDIIRLRILIPEALIYPDFLLLHSTSDPISAHMV